VEIDSSKTGPGLTDPARCFDARETRISGAAPAFPRQGFPQPSSVVCDSELKMHRPQPSHSMPTAACRAVRFPAEPFCTFPLDPHWLEEMSFVKRAENAMEHELMEIEATLPSFRGATDRDDREALDQSDVAFHLAMLRASHDQLMIEALELFCSMMWPRPRLPHRHSGARGL
jgi:hypothetical protein